MTLFPYPLVSERDAEQYKSDASRERRYGLSNNHQLVQGAVRTIPAQTARVVSTSARRRPHKREQQSSGSARRMNADYTTIPKRQCRIH